MPNYGKYYIGIRLLLLKTVHETLFFREAHPHFHPLKTLQKRKNRKHIQPDSANWMCFLLLFL